MQLTSNQLIQLKSILKDELTKRGFHAEIIQCECVPKLNGKGSYKVEFSTATFQTTPVLFKSIRVVNANSSIFTELIEENEVTCISIRIHAEYQHFGGGTNGCELFLFFCCVSYETDCLYDIKLS